MNRCVVALLCVSLFPWDCLAEEIKSQTVKKNQNEEVVMQNASNAKHDDAKKPNPHPDAQWFKTAGMGLFMHFGLSSVKGGELSWSMYKDYADGAGPSLWPPDSYYGLAQQFNPQNYDANIIMAAAARAGFKYAVLTVRHHDGYALWPSDYGDFSTKQYIGGRDLLRPYVEACRKYGIKVGFYYSPTDWHYNPAGWPWRGFPLADKNFEYTPWLHKEHPHFVDMPQAELQGYMDQFYAYVKGQVGELLSRYGKIDLLWWDGYDWPGTVDIHSKDMVTFVYSLQPGIVLNPRYGLWSMGWGCLVVVILVHLKAFFPRRNPQIFGNTMAIFAATGRIQTRAISHQFMEHRPLLCSRSLLLLVHGEEITCQMLALHLMGQCRSIIIIFVGS